ncbi:hypothetical protein [Sinomicrobium sp.]
MKRTITLLTFLIAVVSGFSQEATVYIARNNGFAGSGAPAHIFHEYNYLGKLKQKQNYIEIKVPPGENRFAMVANLGFARGITIDVQPSAEYYINVNLSKGDPILDVTNNAALRQKVIKRVNKNERISLSQEEKSDNQSRFRDRLAKTYTKHTAPAAGDSRQLLASTSGQGLSAISNLAALTVLDAVSDTTATDAPPTATLDTAIDYNNMNLREIARREILKIKAESGYMRDSETEAAIGYSTAVTPEGGRTRIDRVSHDELSGLKYRRSSLYTLMIDDPNIEHYQVIKDAFGNTQLSEKFNNHNIGPYLIPGSGGLDDQTIHIENYLNTNKVARELVAKWFNRSEKGTFNMDLVAERGQYNASDLNVKIAMQSQRGQALLKDAGEELIGNTFVIVYDYQYTNKQDQAQKRGGFLSALSSVASVVPGGENLSYIAQGAKMASDVVGKGYFVRTTSYLYQLVWDEQTANTFYSQYWMDEDSYDPEKKAAFDQSTAFKLKYVGSEVSRNNLQSTIFSAKNNEQLIEIATTRAVDKNIGKLQRTFEEFRVKTPLLSGDPISAKIGLKEDIEKGDKFEVLEQILNEDGSTSYQRVGIVVVDKNHIWDNTYLADEAEGADLSENYTRFKGKSGKYASGMLIRQLN